MGVFNYIEPLTTFIWLMVVTALMIIGLILEGSGGSENMLAFLYITLFSSFFSACFLGYLYYSGYFDGMWTNVVAPVVL